MTQQARRRGDRGRGGQAVVEFALVLPVFVLLVFGALEFGRAYYNMHLLTNAAREGARRASLPNQTEAEVMDTVEGFLTGVGLPLEECTISMAVEDSNGSEREGGLAAALEGDAVTVSVTYDFRVLVGSLLPGFSGIVPMTGRCTFRHE